MFGALLTDPIHPEADFGVSFMDTGEYLNMCGHGTIGSVTALIETGLVEAKEPYTEVVLDAPAGLIRTKAEVKNGKVLNVTLTNVPAFLYKENLTTVIDGKKIKYDISFGGSFFALVDLSQIGKTVTPENIQELTRFGMQLVKQVNEEVKIKHPTLDITSVDPRRTVLFYDNPWMHHEKCRNLWRHMADRSPCGTGTSAKLARTVCPRPNRHERTFCI